MQENYLEMVRQSERKASPPPKGSLADLWDNGLREVSSRMDLSNVGLAEQLKLQGVVIGGVHCRTSQYKPRPKSPSS